MVTERDQLKSGERHLLMMWQKRKLPGMKPMTSLKIVLAGESSSPDALKGILGTKSK